MDNTHKEHIITFAISFDEDRVVKIAEDAAVKQIVNGVDKAIKQKTEGRGYYAESDLDRMIANRVNVFFNTHKEEILEKAADKLAEKLARSKAGKELIKNLNEALVLKMENEEVGK